MSSEKELFYAYYIMVLGSLLAFSGLGHRTPVFAMFGAWSTMAGAYFVNNATDRYSRDETKKGRKND